MSEADHHRLSTLIEEEVTSGQIRLKEANLKDLKLLCRRHDDLIREAFRLLRRHLERNHAEARWSAYLLVKELFERSHLFRELLIDDLHEFLVLVAEIDRSQPLPPPKPVACRLKEHSVATLKIWFEKFGNSYKKLELGFNFLKDTQKIRISNASPAPANLYVVPTAAKDTNVGSLNRKRIDRVLAEHVEHQEEMDSLLTEIENLFGLIVPDFENSLDSDSTPTTSSSHSSSLRHHGLHSSTYHVQVELLPVSFRVNRTAENEAMIEKIEENSILLNRKFLPKVVGWLAILSKSGAEEENVKAFIDAKQRLEGALRKAAALGIQFARPMVRRKRAAETAEGEDSEEEENDFEEVPEKEGLELVIPPNKRKEYGLEMISQNAQRSSNDDAPCCSKTLAPESSSSQGATNSALLSKAPIVKFGADLEGWGQDKAPTASFQSPYEGLHRFWRSSDATPEEFTNQEVAASLTNRAIPFIGKFEPVKWFCRAPLPSGQLCPRMDRERCPFHGKVVPRGPDGVPAREDDRYREMLEKEKATASRTPDWQDPALLRDIEAQTGRNLKVEKRKKAKKDGNLTDVKALTENPRKRLEKIVLNKSAVSRVAGELDRIQKQDAAEKFSHNWNYSTL
ncbi:UV-stimulated scaffold protein A [Hypsibius exemplaris]|uniref:UV-stimulated scaffold protein A n=1 Tax=Hypsibius exemplaris TaxID=2072580 RepID=A0A1W0X9I1_HYPEX|nr:UV-stimulated scaffold protein A [Hypsibius exemplaris]